MIFKLNTDECENISLSLNEDEDTAANIMDFCFGISAFYTDFCMQLGLDQEQCRSLLKVCQSQMTQFVEEILSEDLLDPDDENDEESDPVFAEELDEMQQAMADRGFTEEEIVNIVKFVRDAGSMEAALGELRGMLADVEKGITEEEEID